MDLTSQTLPVLDVVDIETRLKTLGTQATRLRHALVGLGTTYINKLSRGSGRNNNGMMTRIRDSILFRMDGVLFHLRLLRIIQHEHQARLQQFDLNSRERTLLFCDGYNEQMQIFDSIVFHAISMFDYFGNLIDLCCGPGQEVRHKWIGLVKSCSDANSRLSRSPIATTVKQLDAEFVNLLYDHRSGFIHYSIDRDRSQTNVDLMNGQSDFVVLAPKTIVKHFPSLRTIAASERLTLYYVAFWLAENSLETASQLVGPIRDHITLNRQSAEARDITLRTPK